MNLSYFRANIAGLTNLSLPTLTVLTDKSAAMPSLKETAADKSNQAVKPKVN
ncbi:hypothetical protein [Pragia fontium]|uniref:hypothetical protein n=1 Tax=Pragia fontium TaxID=82985 RepID=UPI000F6F0AA9|nr:hypothetical protein [Pragia fontium]VEJ53527.1 Uncharacterised protein [Pragia fontium]